jgi:hypothetical protein
MKESQLREESRELLSLVQEAAQSGDLDRVDGAAWQPVRDFLAERVGLARAAGLQARRRPPSSSSPSSSRCSRACARVLANDPDGSATSCGGHVRLLDQLGLFTTEMYQKRARR